MQKNVAKETVIEFMFAGMCFSNSGNIHRY